MTVEIDPVAAVIGGVACLLIFGYLAYGCWKIINIFRDSS